MGEKLLEKQIVDMIEEARKINPDISLKFCLRVMEIAARRFDETPFSYTLPSEIYTAQRRDYILQQLKMYLDTKTVSHGHQYEMF